MISALARLYQSGGMAARAAQTFQIVLTRDGRNRDALLGLAQTAQAAGDKDLSQSAQQPALAAFPQDYQVRLTLAQVAQARGDRSGAVRLLKEARALYARQSGSNGIDAFGGNPFAGDPMGVGSGNPFRDRAVAQPQPVLNPFSLGNGTRLPTANAPVAQPQPAFRLWGTRQLRGTGQLRRARLQQPGIWFTGLRRSGLWYASLWCTNLRRPGLWNRSCALWSDRYRK
jgi:tetratricopeptide (TPR) repeat protein